MTWVLWSKKICRKDESTEIRKKNKAEFLCHRCRRRNNCSNMRRPRRISTANDSNSSKVYRREDQIATAHIEPAIFTLTRCASAVLFFSCCGSAVALPTSANCNEHVSKRNISRPYSARFAQRPEHDKYERENFLFLVPNYHTEFLTLGAV